MVEMLLGRFKPHRTKSGRLEVVLTSPKEQMGKIHGKMRGPFKVPGTQEFELVVTRGKENETYELLLSLLSDYKRQ